MTHTKQQYTVTRRRDNWITLDYQHLFVQAQVFPVPSMLGIGARDNEGNWLCDPEHMPESARISRLIIRTFTKPHTVIYNYDRGLDEDYASPAILQGAIEAVLHAAR